MNKEEYVAKKMKFHGCDQWDNPSFGYQLLTLSFSYEYDCLKAVEECFSSFEHITPEIEEILAKNLGQLYEN